MAQPVSARPAPSRSQQADPPRLARLPQRTREGLVFAAVVGEDPHTGRPAMDLASVTIVGPGLTLADAYATAAFAMGGDAPGWLAELSGYESYVLDAGGHAWWSPGFGAYQPAER